MAEPPLPSLDEMMHAVFVTVSFVSFGPTVCSQKYVFDVPFAIGSGMVTTVLPEFFRTSPEPQSASRVVTVRLTLPSFSTTTWYSITSPTWALSGPSTLPEVESTRCLLVDLHLRLEDQREDLVAAARRRHDGVGLRDRVLRGRDARLVLDLIADLAAGDRVAAVVGLGLRRRRSGRASTRCCRSSP